ncbi:MAG: DUF4446 family protein, partial [Solirubrobacterales bacterium]|nr:DUF4446 family protein [Solirubrobacterales bacterium]
TGIIAITAAAIAVAALLLSAALAFRLRRVRMEQRVVLGGQSRDLVGQAAELQSQFETLHKYVEDIASALENRVAGVEDRLDGTLSYRALVRYDALGEMSGRQSASLALLDGTASGLVFSSIHHRDQARMYIQAIQDGRPEHRLSPEESAAIDLALGQATQQSQLA